MALSSQIKRKQKRKRPRGVSIFHLCLAKKLFAWVWDRCTMPAILFASLLVLCHLSRLLMKWLGG